MQAQLVFLLEMNESIGKKIFQQDHSKMKYDERFLQDLITKDTWKANASADDQEIMKDTLGMASGLSS